MLKTKTIPSGAWRTVETFWNANGTAFFRAPAGARIKVRYGIGFFGFDRQVQTLNGSDYRTLRIGRASVAYARMQVSVSRTVDVTYDVYAGGISIVTPEIRF
jgi:hypothetical protein